MIGRHPSACLFERGKWKERRDIWIVKRIPLASNGHDPMRGRPNKTSKMEGYHLKSYRAGEGLSILFSSPKE